MSRLRYHIRILFVAILLLNLCGLISLQAQTGELRRPFQAVRNLGMGNTGIALSFDENALFYNPAGLVGVDAILVGFPFLFEVSEDSVDIVNEISKLDGSSNTAEVVELLMGKRVHFRNLVDINVIMPFGELVTIGGASGVEAQLDLGVRNPVAIEIDLGLRLDRITNLGFGLPLARGRWLFGASIASVERCDIPLTTATIGTVLTNTDLSSTFGTCELTNLKKAQTFNFGFQRRLESASALKMTWGFTANNVGGLKFNRSDNETSPADQQPEFSTGLSWQPDWGPFRWLFAFDLRDLTMKHADDTYCQTKKDTNCIIKRLHLGTELGMIPIDSGASAFAIRAGYNQGYFTHGFEFNPFIFARGLNIQYAVYKTETGNKPGNSPDKRRVLQVNFGF
ncbi:MAG: hypothetical protein QGI65_07230 [SAR324 cluster bacterium]|jgi:hypothetical protein|nr:hypothetical protein [SAR324 cluster bacterium]MDP6522164.1 hypothetical protein [SAR324 cluster bacterium]|tara:strand:- start:446 stop:1633 length:1188 start_codon:yes stop_codon:yes gene_type:complete